MFFRGAQVLEILIGDLVLKAELGQQFLPTSLAITRRLIHAVSFCDLRKDPAGPVRIRRISMGQATRSPALPVHGVCLHLERPGRVIAGPENSCAPELI